MSNFTEEYADTAVAAPRGELNAPDSGKRTKLATEGGVSLLSTSGPWDGGAVDANRLSFTRSVLNEGGCLTPAIMPVIAIILFRERTTMPSGLRFEALM
jgi:hypothetical protein